MFTALHLVLVVQVCMQPSLADRPQKQHGQLETDSPTALGISGSHPQVELLKPQSASAVESSTALLGVSQNATGFVLKKSLDSILNGVLANLVIQDDCAANPDTCPFKGTITVRHQGGVCVGCTEHLTMPGDKNVIHATGLATDLAVDLDGFKISGITLNGVAYGHVEMPAIFLAIYAGKTDLDTETTETWSLRITGYDNRGGVGNGGIVGGALSWLTQTFPQAQVMLGNTVLNLLKPVIVQAIKDNVEVYTDNAGTRSAMGISRFVDRAANFVTTGSFNSQPGCVGDKAIGKCGR